MNEQDLKKIIEKGITIKVEECYEEIKSKLLEKLEKDKQEMIAGIAIDITKMYSIYRNGADLVVTIIQK